MRPLESQIVYVLSLLIAFILLSGLETVEGTPSRWCHEAHQKDPRINYQFCYEHFLASWSINWDNPWRMAKVAASYGAHNGNSVVIYTQTHLANPHTSPKIKPVLQECQELYDKVKDAFLRAKWKLDDKSGPGCADARREAALAEGHAQGCEDAFARAGVPSLRNAAFEANKQFGYICLALITILGH